MKIEGIDTTAEIIMQSETSYEPKASIIIPVYNVELYLRQCLDSVINQTLREIEIICVNDGSTDNSLAILQEYAARDSRVIVFSKTNGGLSSARNFGIKHSSGEYVYFMDSDDYLELNAIEVLYNEAKKDNLDILYFDGIRFCEDPSMEEVLKKQKLPFDYIRGGKEESEVLKGSEMILFITAKKKFNSSACLQFLKSEYLKSKNISFYDGIIHEDNLFTLQALILAERTRVINNKFFNRRLRSNSIMTIKESYKNCNKRQQ